MITVKSLKFATIDALSPAKCKEAKILINTSISLVASGGCCHKENIIHSCLKIITNNRVSCYRPVCSLRLLFVLMTGDPSQLELRLLLFSYVTAVDIGVMTCRNLKDFRVNYVKQISGQFKYTKKVELSKLSIAHKRKKDFNSTS